MDTVRIAALLEPFLDALSLAESQLDQISIYIDLLMRWNARINLTAIRTEEEIATRHFGESLFMASHLFPASLARTLLPANADSARRPEGSQRLTQCRPERSPAGGEAKSKDPGSSTATRVLDIGSGAGFPALPLKIWAPHIRLTMIESNHKKAAFLREVTRTLTLTEVNVITDRVEVLAERQEALQAEVVTLRAVERFETILPSAISLLAPAGRLALLIGEKQLPHLAALTTLNWNVPMAVPQSQARVLSIGIRS
jgi:16S rRNA (guanine527-N7)-methyltransferase